MELRPYDSKPDVVTAETFASIVVIGAAAVLLSGGQGDVAKIFRPLEIQASTSSTTAIGLAF
jgi:hypothetical protein